MTIYSFSTQLGGIHKASLIQLFILRSEMEQFLSAKDHQHAKEFSNSHFLSNVFKHMNFLNTNLQGHDTFIFDLHHTVRAFIRKIDVMIAQVKEQEFSSFPCYLEFQATADIEFGEDVNYSVEIRSLCDYLASLKVNFEDRFPSVSENHDIIVSPFKVDATKVDQFGLEIAELQEDDEAKIDFFCVLADQT